MKTPDKKDSNELKSSICGALVSAEERIIEAANLLVFAEGEEGFHAAQHALENAVFTRMDLMEIHENLDKMYSKVELETAVKEAHQAIITRSARRPKVSKKGITKDLPKAA